MYIYFNSCHTFSAALTILGNNNSLIAFKQGICCFVLFFFVVGFVFAHDL